MAEVHHPECSGFANSIDHLTPRSVAKELRWTGEQLHSEENLIPMDRKCHDIKDQETPAMLALVRAQLREQIDLSTIEKHQDFYQEKRRD